jgi:hypothetical protein
MQFLIDAGQSTRAISRPCMRRAAVTHAGAQISQDVLVSEKLLVSTVRRSPESQRAIYAVKLPTHIPTYVAIKTGPS